MKVLLMVQTGDERPKCVKQFGSRVAWARQYMEKIAFGAEGQPARGWLVQAESAEAARAVIARESGFTNVTRPERNEAQGRILASGGKA